jgi:hypothetical protein
VLTVAAKMSPYLHIRDGSTRTYAFLPDAPRIIVGYTTALQRTGLPRWSLSSPKPQEAVSSRSKLLPLPQVFLDLSCGSANRADRGGKFLLSDSERLCPTTRRIFLF